MEVIVIITWILCGIIGAAIGGKNDNAGTGLLLGLLFGPLGLIIVAILTLRPTEEPPPTDTPSGTLSRSAFRRKLIKEDAAHRYMSTEDLDRRYEAYLAADAEKQPPAQAEKPPPPASIETRLQRLKSLHDAGEIDEQEHQTARERILSEL